MYDPLWIESPQDPSGYRFQGSILLETGLISSLISIAPLT